MHGWKYAALFLLAIAPTIPAQTPGPSVIEMTDNMVFLPKELTVSVGEVVVWKNVSKMPHSVNTNPESCRTEEGKKWVKVPNGGTHFTSGEIKPDDEFRVRFEMPGTYQYLCTFHEDQMMRGTIIVQGSR